MGTECTSVTSAMSSQFAHLNAAIPTAFMCALVRFLVGMLVADMTNQLTTGGEGCVAVIILASMRLRPAMGLEEDGFRT